MTDLHYAFSRVLICLCLGLTQAYGADYFWVGGSGSWSDLQHWATTSGGSTYHLTIPTADDDVFFDVNSFAEEGQIVTVSLPVIFCKSLNFKNLDKKMSFVGAVGQAIHVAGSLYLHPAMQQAYEGVWHFVGKDQNNIDLAGHPLPGGAIIEGDPSASWTLNSDFILGGPWVLYSGAFHAGHYRIEATKALFLPSAPLKVDLGTAEIHLQKMDFVPNVVMRDAELFFWNNSFLNFQAGESKIFIHQDNPDVLVEGLGPVTLHTLILTSDQGTSTFSHPLLLQRQTLRAQRVDIHNNADIHYALDLDTLQLFPGHQYAWTSAHNQDIDVLISEGLCSAPIAIHSLTQNSSTNIQINHQASIIYNSIRDVHFISTQVITAFNSTDLGNNQGMTIAEKAVTSLYWVGGSGRWHDIAHWSFSSGGPGGACLPTGREDVIFDDLSFIQVQDSILLDQSADCHSMLWQVTTRQPKIIANADQDLHVFGSLILAQSLNWLFRGDIYLRSNHPGNRILCAGKELNQDLIIDGSGEWTTEDTLNVREQLELRAGTLNTRGQVIISETINCTGNRSRALLLNTSQIILRSKRMFAVRWDLSDQNLTFDPGVSTIRMLGHESQFNTSVTKEEVEYHRVEFFCDKNILLNNSQGRVRYAQAIYGGNTLTRGEHLYQFLHLYPGYEQTFGPDHQIFRMDTLKADGSCQGNILIKGEIVGREVVFQSDYNQSVSKIIIQDIHTQGPGIFHAQDLTELGINSGWVKENTTGRKLYWVGGSGSWNDPAHWSLSSGGSGGECAPGPADDVQVDNKSLQAGSSLIKATGADMKYCHNFIWTYPGGNLVLDRLVAYGEIKLPSATDVHLEKLILRGTKDHDLFLGQHNYPYISTEGSGHWHLRDDFTFGLWEKTLGFTHFHQANLRGDFFSLQSLSDTCHVFLDQSKITLDGAAGLTRGSLSVYGEHCVVDGGQSELVLTHSQAKMYLSGALHFNRVLFTAPEGVGVMQSNTELDSRPAIHVRYLQFYGDGILWGPHIMDTLIFTPGHTYTLESRILQIVKEHWQIRGWNCAFIKLVTTEPGVPAVVEKYQGQVLGDFIEMQDQIARGGAAFYAGQHSTNLNNSSQGWSFNAPPDYVEDGILGPDRIICPGESVHLDLSVWGAQSYTWQDGLESPTYSIYTPQKYWVSAFFREDCIIIDSLNLGGLEVLKPSLGPDTLLCHQSVLLLDGQVTVKSATYQWTHGPQTPQLEVDKAGTYILNAVQGQCTMADTVEVNFLPPHMDALPDLITFCGSGQDLLIKPAVDEHTVITWPDGSGKNYWTASRPDTYVIQFSQGHCSWWDTTTMMVLPAPLVIEQDTINICHSAEVKLKVTDPQAQVIWSDGSTNAEFRATLTTSGYVWGRAERGTCTVTDSVYISVRSPLGLDLGPDQFICPADTLRLSPNEGFEAWLWDNGTRQAHRWISEPGTYTLVAYKNGCAETDTVNVRSTQSAVLDLGPDTTICKGDFIDLSLSLPGVENYLWQDGKGGNSRHIDHSGRYWVRVRDAFCTYHDTIWISVEDCYEPNLHIPNVFSPNGDGVNDEFLITIYPPEYVLSYELHIWDRWGQLVFHSEDQHTLWNGLVSGHTTVSSVFTYTLKLNMQYGSQERKLLYAGDVTMVR